MSKITLKKSIFDIIFVFRAKIVRWTFGRRRSGWRLRLIPMDENCNLWYNLGRDYTVPVRVTRSGTKN